MKKYIIGVDLGGTNLKIGLLNLDLKLLKKITLPTKQFSYKEQLIKAIVESTREILKLKKLKEEDLLGLGLGVPGPVDVEKGIVYFFPNIPGWKNVKLKEILTRLLGVPVFIDNDANLMALAEINLGAGKNFKHAIFITLGTGVGGALYLNGRLYYGRDFCAGEIGHIPINENGPKCGCGGFGCLESYIGNERILNLAKRKFKKNISLEELSRLAKNKNKLALSIWSEVARHLGNCLVGLVNLLNPQAIIIGGGIAEAGKFFFAEVKKVVSERAMPVQKKNLKLLKAKLTKDAGILGSAILVKKRQKGGSINADFH